MSAYTFSKDDISYDLASRAHYAVSFSPEKRGEQVQAEYLSDIQHAAEMFKKAGVPVDEFERYKRGLISRYNSWLNSKSRCMSSMITGPANFPVRKAQKASDAEYTKMVELIDYTKRIPQKICNRYSPNPNIIKSGDSEAVEKLKAKIEKEEKIRERMKGINAAFRSFKKTGKPDALYKLDFSDEGIKELEKEIENAYSWEKQPFPSWQLQNLGANIRRLKDRLKRLEATKEKGNTEKEYREDFRVVSNTEIMRLQLFFPKEREDYRAIVKSHGFRWSPRGKCWQRQLTANAKFTLERLLQELPK